MRVLLTGASGYLGEILANRLVCLPEVEVLTGISRFLPQYTMIPKMRFLPLDIRSADLAAAVAGHDVVIHAAFVVLWSAAMTAKERDDINLRGTENIATAAVQRNVKRFIFASSMGAYDPRLVRGESNILEDFPLSGVDPFYYYWANKAAAERIVRDVFRSSSTILTLLRPTYIVGPGNHVTVPGLKKNAVNFPRRDPRRQFIHEEDVAEAFIQAACTSMPGAYNVVPDDFIHLSDVWRIVGRKTVKTVPAWLARSVTYLQWRLGGSSIHPAWVQDLLSDFTGSNSKLKSTGWQPKCGSADALRSAQCLSKDKEDCVAKNWRFLK